MPRKNLPYVNAYKDRTGKMRYYLRRPGCRQVSLKGAPGSREFMQAYAAATSAPKRPKKTLLRPKNGHVYFLSDGNHVKIGFTIDWERRQKAYRTHTARELAVLALQPGYMADETRLHRRFKRYQINKGEWFYPGPELLDHIKNLTAA